MTGARCKFYWQGHNQQGQSITGETLATDISDLKVQLYRQGVVLKRTIQPRSGLSRTIAERLRSGVRPDAILTFLEQLHSLLKAGIPLVQALDIAGNSASTPALKRLLDNLQQQVSDGSALHEAMRRHPQQFDSMTVSLVSVGELSGSLETMLARITTYLQQRSHVSRQIKKAMQYPAIVLVIALVVSLILLTRVVPQFARSFGSFGAELPAFTQWVMTLSDLTVAYGLPLLTLSALTCALLAMFWRRSEMLMDTSDRFWLGIPVLGRTVRAACISRFCRTLATLVSSGLPLVQALRATAPTTGNRVYQQATLHITRQVSEGQTLCASIRNSDLFPVMMSQLIHAGEQAGTLDIMLDKCADHYQLQLETSVGALTSLLEPAIMTILGVMTGGLMLAMYLPVFRLGTVL